jgi:hypothetical protein
MSSWPTFPFSPKGATQLRQFLKGSDRHDLYRAHSAKLDAADRSIMVHGAHTDGKHLDSSGYWHPWFRDLHDTPKDARKDFVSKLKNDLFDYVSSQTIPSALILKCHLQATAIDRITGGFTLILHHSGAVHHSLNIRPSNLHAEVSMPPCVLFRCPELQQPVADIMQMFIQNVAPTVIQNWIDGVKIEWPGLRKQWSTVGWRSLDPKLFVEFPPPVSPSSSRYKFQGRPPSASFRRTASYQADGPRAHGTPSSDAEAQLLLSSMHQARGTHGTSSASQPRSHCSVQSSGGSEVRT